MGFFSWKTQDTNRSIDNKYSNESTFPVTMIDNKGNRFLETKYDGYGVFGGKDYYILLAEMNGINGLDEEDMRNNAISKVYQYSQNDENPELIYPNLVEYPDNWTYTPNSPENCEFQGFFYTDDDPYYDDEDDTYNENDSY